MSSRKRKADVAFATQGGGNNGGGGSVQRSLRPRLNSTAVRASSSTPVAAVPSTGTGSVVSSAFKLAQQRQQAAELRQQQQQRKRAEKQRNERTLHRARIKQLAAALKDPAHWEAVDTKHGNKHLVRLTKGKHGAELGEVEQHWQNTQGHGTIVSVHRIQNSALHQRFEGARLDTPSLTEQVAYHGTLANVPAGIYDSPTGFNMRCGVYAPGSATQ
jgi:hypothetical protein